MSPCLILPDSATGPLHQLGLGGGYHAPFVSRQQSQKQVLRTYLIVVESGSRRSKAYCLSYPANTQVRHPERRMLQPERLGSSIIKVF